MNLGAISTLVFDLDGVVWRGDTPIESAITAINELRAAGKRCLYCTNNSSKTQAAFVAKLSGMGIEGVAEEDVITSSMATATYLSAQFTGPFLAYVVGGEGIRLALQKIGARIVPDSDITGDTNVDCVIAGIDREFNFEKLTTAQRLIRRGALFVATNRDATYPIEDGVIPGSGAIVSAIETAAGSTPVTIGKPRPVMLQLVMQKYNLRPEEMAFIGDRLDTDIVCARRAGVPALLVTTGVTTLAEARRAKGEMRPDAVFPELTSFAGVMLGHAVEAPAEAATATAVAAVSTAAVAPSATASEDVVPESAPMVQEASPEVSEIAGEPVTAESTGTEAVADSGFALDTGDTGIVSGSPTETSATETPDELLAFDASFEALATDATLPVGDETPLAAASSDEAITASDEATEGWDDSWFAESETESAATKGDTLSTETAFEDTVAADDDGTTFEIQDVTATETVEAEKVEEDKKEDTPASTNSFDWKLD